MNILIKLYNSCLHLKKGYNFRLKKKKIRRSSETFTTKGNPISFEVIKDNYFVFREIFAEDFYEIAKVLKLVSEKPVILDIGANVGFFCVMILSKRPNARIYAYEPFENNCLKLNKTIENNHLQNNIFLFKEAVTKNHGDTIQLFYKTSKEESSIASIYQKFDPQNEEIVEVKTTNMENIFSSNKIDELDILKMDCEGAEFEILYNTPDSIYKKIKLILLEVHNMDDETMNHKALRPFIENKGFTITEKLFENGCYYFFAKNNQYYNA